MMLQIHVLRTGKHHLVRTVHRLSICGGIYLHFETCYGFGTLA